MTWGPEGSITECRPHYDIEMSPNGNAPMIAWKHATNAEAISAGRNPSLLTDGERSAIESPSTSAIAFDQERTAQDRAGTIALRFEHDP